MCIVDMQWLWLLTVYLRFRYDHQERLTAQEAMAHPFFLPVRSSDGPVGKGEVISLVDSD